jgi:hypothetical protein
VIDNRNSMMKFPHTLLGAVLLCGALPAWATVCQNERRREGYLLRPLKRL